MPDFMHCSTACLSATILGDDFNSSDSLIIGCSLRSDKDLLLSCTFHRRASSRSPALHRKRLSLSLAVSVFRPVTMRQPCSSTKLQIGPMLKFASVDLLLLRQLLRRGVVRGDSCCVNFRHFSLP